MSDLVSNMMQWCFVLVTVHTISFKIFLKNKIPELLMDLQQVLLNLRFLASFEVLPLKRRMRKGGAEVLELCQGCGCSERCLLFSTTACTVQSCDSRSSGEEFCPNTLVL